MDQKSTNGGLVKRLFRRLKDSLNPKKAFFPGELLAENERRANRLVVVVMLLTECVMLLSLLFNEIGIYRVEKTSMRALACWSIVLLVPVILEIVYRGRKSWLKIVMLTVLTLFFAHADAVLSFHVVLVMAIPVVLSCRYYSCRLTVWVALLTTVVFGFSAYAAIVHSGNDLNFIELPAGTVITVTDTLRHAVQSLKIDTEPQEYRMLLYSFLPKYLLFVLIAYVSVRIADAGRRMLEKQDRISQDYSRVETELEVAREIQSRALPSVSMLPPHALYDIAAAMYPAKEVGGDFYDFIQIDPTHMALFIADISGKGVPASLLMMLSKLMIDSSIARNRCSPGLILADVNHRLCEENLDSMFVTCWLGILNLQTGVMSTANAGHEYPMICRAGGKFEVIKDKHGLVLGAMEGSRYTETTLQLQPGDTLFVYTDGVPEAMNAGQEAYGLERAAAALDRVGTGNMDALVTTLKADIDTFCGEEPQFDDTTMLAFRLDALAVQEGITVKPDEASVSIVERYIEETLSGNGVDRKRSYKVSIAVDELYANIVQYSGAVWAQVICDVDDSGLVTVILRDNGVPYDPLKAPEPDITQSAEDRKVGGLGIFMTRKLMSSLQYNSDKGHNETVITLLPDEKQQN